MCGIAGFFDITQSDSTDAKYSHIRQMLKSIELRGPDNQKIIYDGNVVIGFNRLSIVGVKNGDQPFINCDTSVYVFVNGEIYNYVELLNKYHIELHGSSDCEIVLHLYLMLGVEVFAQLDGMFSIAIYDKRINKIILSTDPFGIKPMYYYLDNNTLVFASEIKAIKSHPKVNTSFDFNRFFAHSLCHKSTFFVMGFIPFSQILTT